MSDDKKDMTRIEDLSEYLHETDPETEAALESTDASIKTDITDLDDDEDNGSDSEDLSAGAFGDDDTQEFGSEDSDDDAQEFGAEDPDDDTQEFGAEEDNSFGPDDEQEFGAEEDNSFGSDDEQEFGAEEDNSFGPDDEQEFGAEDDNSFGEDDTAEFGSDESDEDDDTFGSDDESEAEFDSEETMEESAFMEGDLDPEEESGLEAAGDFDSDDQDNDELEAAAEDDPFADMGDEGDEDADLSVLEEGGDSGDESMEFGESLDEDAEDLESQLEEEPLPETPTIQEEGGYSMESPQQPLPSQQIVPEAPAAGERENFSEVRNFAQNVTYGTMSAGGNPPFALIIKNIRFKEDAEGIKSILTEFGLCSDSNEADIDQGLENGIVLISQISEFSSIYLAHQLRRFDIEIEWGLSEEIHPSDSYTSEHVGLVSKENLQQNKSMHFNLEKNTFRLDEIMLATTPTLQGHKIEHYLNIVSEDKILNEDDLREMTREVLSKDSDDPDSFDVKESTEDWDEGEGNLSQLTPGLGEVYKELSSRLREKALHLGGNAVVGINFQIIPQLGGGPRGSGEIKPSYRIFCIGNVVRVAATGDVGIDGQV